jgi:cell division transport system permease protein
MTANRSRFFVSEALRSLRNNFATTLAAVVTVLIVLYVFGVGAALGSYIYSYAQTVRGNVTVKIWLSDTATDAQRQAILGQIRSDPRIQPASLRFVNKAQAQQEANHIFPKDELKFIYGDPFPARYEVRAKNPDQTAAIAASLAGLPGLIPSVKGSPNPDYGSAAANQVLSTAGVIEVVIGGIAVVLGIASVLLIGNTIRLSIFARRREVEVMKLVGATNWFVRWPFMLEGMICGILGALGALAVMLVSYEALKGYFKGETLNHATNNVSALPFWQLALILVAAGLALGAAGSGLTMRKFLRI